MGNKTPAMTLQDIPASEFDAALGRKCEWVSGWRASASVISASATSIPSAHTTAIVNARGTTATED